MWAGALRTAGCTRAPRSPSMSMPRPRGAGSADRAPQTVGLHAHAVPAAAGMRGPRRARGRRAARACAQQSLKQEGRPGCSPA